MPPAFSIKSQCLPAFHTKNNKVPFLHCQLIWWGCGGTSSLSDTFWPSKGQLLNRIGVLDLYKCSNHLILPILIAFRISSFFNLTQLKVICISISVEYSAVLLVGNSLSSPGWSLVTFWGFWTGKFLWSYTQPPTWTAMSFLATSYNMHGLHLNYSFAPDHHTMSSMCILYK